MKKNILSFLALSFLSLPVLSESLDSNIKMNAEGRIRYEFLDNNDFVSNNDQLSFILGRFRLNFSFEPIKTTEIFIQPQYSKTFGQEKLINSGTALVTDSNGADQTVPTASSQNTSGSLVDDSLNVHQAYIRHQFLPGFEIQLGRQEIAYGEQLIIGSVGWSNVGRSFDALKATMNFKWTESDLFYSKIKDRNITSGADGDSNFFGFYNKLSHIPFLEQVDLYYFFWRDASATPNLINLHSIGGRIKSSFKDLDYRLETTLQFGDIAGSNRNDIQTDAEVGYDFKQSLSNRLALHASYASANFNQLFPTAHKWLGHLDLLGRRNVLAFAVHFSNKLTESLSLHFDFHNFYRTKTNSPAYALNGTTAYALGPSSSKEIGREMDFVGNYKINSALQFSSGVSYFFTGKYLDEAIGNKNPYKVYSQLIANY